MPVHGNSKRLVYRSVVSHLGVRELMSQEKAARYLQGDGEEWVQGKEIDLGGGRGAALLE